MELENILADQNWKKIGACEISCVGVYDTETKSADADLMKVVNDRITQSVQAGIKPKTEIELLKEQNALLSEKLDSLTEKVNNPVVAESKKEEIPSPPPGTGLPTGKEIRDALFAEAKELGLNPPKNVKTEILKDLIVKAKQ